MMRLLGSRSRTERGAIAVIAGILVVVLVSMAAIAIDLGNAWSRRRMVQSQVDVSALSAGHRLPRTAANETQIAIEVAKYLNDAANKVYGQGVSPVTATQLLDGNLANGEIQFPDPDGSRMRVIAPPAKVDYGFAKVMGFQSQDVRAEATVELFGGLPPKEDVMPMWLPSGCIFGPGTGDTSSHGPSSASATSTPTTSASPSPYTPPEQTDNGFTVTSVTGSPAVQGSSGNVQVALAGLAQNSQSGSIRFALDSGTVGVATAVSWPKVTSATGDTRTVTVNVNPNVTSTPGTWSVYGLVDTSNSQRVTTNHVSFVVTPTATSIPTPTTTAPTPTASMSTSTGCSVSEVGNFGQLNSPRSDTNQLQLALAKNIALGNDHLVLPWDPASPPSSNNCGQNEAQKISGAQLDTESRDNNNCVDVQQGNDGGALTDGLITGGTGFKGRLDSSKPDGHTTCPSRGDVTVKGTSINNDILSCFLRNGATLDTLTTAGGPDAVSESWLDPNVTKSPRFVWVPVVYAGNRASHEFQALKEYVPAFITDEHMSNGTLVPATNNNGITMNNGGQQVESIQLFSFNPNILPLDLRSPDQQFNPTKQSQVRLVD
jgi:putative Flp pilus-assembly TadE/G-like protein